MFLYKPLRFNNEQAITSKLLSLVQRINPDKLQSKTIDIDIIRAEIPELMQQFEDIGCFPNICREIISLPYDGTKIHRDGSGGKYKHFSINWPIENCESTYMCWWEFDEEPILDIAMEDPAGIKNYDVLLYKEDNGRLIGKYEIISPTLTNIHVYHSVINADKIRRMLSFRFDPEPFHLINHE
jgi:hypothetical protein